MGKIRINSPDKNNDLLDLDYGINDVTLFKTFLGVRFVAESGEILSVSMRDSGFELKYQSTDEDGNLVICKAVCKEGDVVAYRV